MAGVTLSHNFTDEEIEAMEGAICELADMDCAAVEDPLMRDLINAARKIVDRENWLTFDDDDLDPRTPEYGVAPARD